MPVPASSSRAEKSASRSHSRSWPLIGFLGIWCIAFSALIALAVVLNYDSAARENPGLPFPWEHLWFPGVVFGLGICGIVAGPEALYGMYGELDPSGDDRANSEAANHHKGGTPS